MEKFYLVSFENDNVAFNAQVLHSFVVQLFNEKKIAAWWHHFSGVYILKTSLSSYDLYKMIFPKIPGLKLLIIEVSLSNSQGWLPKMAWDWINSGGTK